MISDLPTAAAVSKEALVSPTARTARIADIDVIRGIALFGVLTMNLAYCFRIPLLAIPPPTDHGLDHVVNRLEGIVLASKAMSLFSMLFGAGLCLFLDRASASGANALGLLARRLIFLLLFGIAHAFLVWNGDILIEYAVGGLCALAFIRKRPAVLWIAVVALTLLPPVASAWPALKAFADYRPPHHFEDAVHTYGTGGYLEIVRFRTFEV
ncbi:MAG TPA: hypothetical protein VNO21_02945, partial [Polyangiaceae bacterium]|nr:hypothetical protein [Polyangiaceae bacterium]